MSFIAMIWDTATNLDWRLVVGISVTLLFLSFVSSRD